MAKVKIEDYRGFEISFDTDEELFYCFSDERDKDEYKKSYAGMKKFIDDFIKENTEFKPVWIEKLNYSGLEKKKLIGIRKDGRFIYDKKGEKAQLGEYEEGDYIVSNPDNQPIYDEIFKIEGEIEKLRARRKDLEKDITGTPLKVLKTKYTL